MTLGHGWNHGLQYSSLKHDACANTKGLLGSLMSGNCLNLSGYGTGPHAAVLPREGEKNVLASTFLFCFFYSNSVQHGLQGKPQ